MSANSAVVFLVVNDMGRLGNLAINSVLESTESKIFVGYVNLHDIVNLPVNDRICFLDLATSETVFGGSKYQNYSTELFFQVVSLKWELLEKVLLLDTFDTVIYSDLDVVWFMDVCQSIETLFSTYPWLQVAVQDNSSTIKSLNLCMGLFAIRKSEWSLQFIKGCRELHQRESSTRSKVGDDEIVTEMYKKSENAKNIFLLPQAVFPTGNLVGLSRMMDNYFGLRPPQFAIFHSNYVIGLHKKLLLQYFAIQNKSRRQEYFSKNETFRFRAELVVRFFKIFYLKCILKIRKDS